MVNSVFTIAMARFAGMLSCPPFATTLRGCARAAVLVVLLVPSPALAQAPLQITPPGASEPLQPETKAAREKELEKLRADQKKARENEAKLTSEIAAIGHDRQKLS